MAKKILITLTLLAVLAAAGRSAFARFKKEYKMQVTILTEQEREVFRRKLLPVKQRWIKKLGEKIYGAARLDLNIQR